MQRYACAARYAVILFTATYAAISLALPQMQLSLSLPNLQFCPFHYHVCRDSLCSCSAKLHEVPLRFLWIFIHVGGDIVLQYTWWPPVSSLTVQPRAVKYRFGKRTIGARCRTPHPIAQKNLTCAATLHDTATSRVRNALPKWDLWFLPAAVRAAH